MSKNIFQVFMTNPITSNANTDLMYFGQSPYGTTDDAAMTFANFKAQLSKARTLKQALAIYADSTMNNKHQVAMQSIV